MSNQDAGKVVGLKTPGSADKAQPEATKAAAAPAPGLTGLGSSGSGLTGLGTSGATGGLTGLGTSGTAGGLTGLGSSGAAGGLTGLGSSGAAGGLTGLGSSGAAGGGLTGLGSSGAAGGLTGLGSSGAAGGLTGLGSSGAAGGLTGLGSSGAAGAPPAAAPVEKPVPRKSGISIDVSAADRIKKMLADRGTPGSALRIRVRGGGCTGLQYDMEFAEKPQERDRVFADHDVRIFVDAKSYIFLIGTELRYQSGLLESGFKLENPNSKKACGCGESFTV